jgi:CRP-like cAMP-binding protein
MKGNIMFEVTEDILFKTGDVIFDTEKPLPTAYFILEGKVDLELTLNDEVIHLEIGPNNFLGDAAVAVSQKVKRTTPSYRGRAVAHDAVRAVAIPIEAIKQELDACPPLLKAWFASFISRVLIVMEKLSHR